MEELWVDMGICFVQCWAALLRYVASEAAEEKGSDKREEGCGEEVRRLGETPYFLFKKGILFEKYRNL